jgi:Predicted RNA-binding protein of the translin family
MGLKNVKSSLPQISRELEKTNSSREFLIKNNREVIVNCSQAIIAIHKNDLDSAKLKIKKAKLLLVKLKQKAKGDLDRYLLTPEQELVEAVALLSVIERKQIPTYKSIKVSGESYILGLLDCIGELKRQVIDQIRIGNSKNAERYFGIMEELYLILYPFATYDKIVKEARRKLDVNRMLVERYKD